MAANVADTVGKALSDVNIGTMVASIGQAIATAQQTLDMNSLRVAQMLTGEYQDEKGQTRSSLVSFDGEKLSLMELGFTPTFYQFVETTIEVKISITMSTTDEKSGFNASFAADSDANAKGGANWGLVAEGNDSGGRAGYQGGGAGSSSAALNVALVGASYSSKFQYSAEGSSSIRVRLVPVPPPAILEERVRRSLDRKAQAREQKKT